MTVQHNRDKQRGNPAFQISQLARLIVRYFDRHLAPLRLNVANLAVVGALRERDGLSQKDLTEIGRIGQPAMAQMLERMLKDGLLVRRQDATDRRRAVFSLSSSAAEGLPALEAALEEGNRAVFSVLSEDELEQLLRLLDKLTQHMRTLDERGR
tara:strand:+ start:396 stop:857 length:462 start_codon:yes stop_codon:yes gene_type:complete